MCETVLFTDFLFKSLNRAVLDDLSGGFQCCAPVRSCRFSRLPRREERQERGCVRLGQVLQDTKLVRRSDARGHDRSWDLVQPPSPSEWPPGVGGRRGGTARAQRTGGGAGLSPRHPLFQFGRSAAAPQDRQGANQLYNVSLPSRSPPRGRRQGPGCRYPAARCRTGRSQGFVFWRAHGARDCPGRAGALRACPGR